MRLRAPVRALLVAALVVAGSNAFAQTEPETSTTAQFERELEAIGEGEARATAGSDGDILDFGYLLQVLFMCIAVCLLAYVILGKMLPWMLALSPAARRNMTAAAPRGTIEVVDRLPLDPKHTLFVIKVKGDYFLVGATEQNMTMISRLDSEALGAGEPPDEGLSNRFVALLGRRAQKES